MHKYIPLLLIPIIFTFVLDYFVFQNKELNISKNNLIKESHLRKKNTNIEFNSSAVMKFYSEKIIQHSHENIVIRLKPKIKKKFIDNDENKNLFSNLESNNFLIFESSNWQDNLSNKKINFIKTILPLIEYENQKIKSERKKLVNISDFLSLEKTLKADDLKYLTRISKKYKVAIKNKHKIDLINELLLNVNVIPNSIVLAQAVNESGWGTSRFAREHNALFGQYTYDKDNGVIPYEREKGKKHLVRNFTSINKSVESYFYNINSHYAYKKFRNLRSQIDNFNNDFNIKILTNALDVYAEDTSYVETINKIIDTNNLIQFNSITNKFLNNKI